MGKRTPAASILVEKRVLAALTLLSTVALITWLVAISTNYWYIISSDDGIYLNETQRFFVYKNAGLWKVCRLSYINITGGPATLVSKCRHHRLFPSDEQVKHDPSIDKGILNYTRTLTCFALISSCLMVMAIVSSLYTFTNPRYMFKRLAGGLHFLSTGTVLIVIEVLVTMVQYEKEHLPYRYPAGAEYHYDYSFVLGWLVFIVYLCSCIAFLVCSRKRKRDKALSEEYDLADENTIIGR